MSGIDFSKLGITSVSDSALHPKDIFAALPYRTKQYEYLRAVQLEVLNTWYESRESSDLVVKMNTGNGKTVVGLLMLKSCLNEKHGPAAYLCPDNYLSRQVSSTADALGIPYTEDPHNSSFTSGHAILITTIHKLFNGKSIFGVFPQNRLIKLGTKLIDDAHACIRIIDEQFQLTIPSEHIVYKNLLRLFSEDLKIQHPSGLLDLEAGVPGVALLVPYWIWQDRTDQVLDLLHSHPEDDEVQWGWKLINDILPLCHCVITPDRLQIKPFFPPVDRIPSFAQSERRIYLTATLADDGILVTQLNAKPETILSPITPSAADDIGDRLILPPQHLQLALGDEEIKEYLQFLSKTYNVVVIVPSNLRAVYWNDVADETLTAKNLEQGIERLKSRKSGFTIMVAKYDGVDLPNDSCRVLAIDGLPEAISPVDQLEKQALDGSPSQTSRQLQRIEQGMGRGIRSRDDYCVVLLLGSKLIERLYEPNASSHFSPATERQLHLSNQVATQLSRTSLKNIDVAVRQCLNRDNGWVSVSRNGVAGVKYGQGHISPSNIELRRAFNFASMNRWEEAIVSQQSVVNATTGVERGWNKQLLASYTYKSDPVEAERLQRSAITDNLHLLKPASGLVYAKIKEGLGDQASQVINYIKNSYKTVDHFMIRWRSLLQDFEFSEDGSMVNNFERSLSEIGSHLGFQTQRPEKEFGRGPDVLWAMDNQEFLIIEAKSATITREISKHDLAQLLSSCEWFERNYGKACTGVPLIIHKSSTPHFTAFGKPETRVMTPHHADSLRRDLRNFGQSFCASWNDVSSRHVAGLLTASGLD